MLLTGDRNGDFSVLVEEPPATYRVVYRVTAPDMVPIDKVVEVKRPYHARVVERQRGAIVGGALSNDNGAFQYVTGTEDQGWQLLQEGRFPATQDFRPVPVLRRAVADGSAVIVGTDELIGRRCTMVRTGAPLGSRLVRPTDDEHVDLCIDRSGIVLSEAWTLGGELVRRTDVREIELAPNFRTPVFRASPEIPGAPPGTAGTPVVIELTPGERVQLAAGFEPPARFRYDGGSTRFRLTDGVAPHQTVVERYRRRIDLLEVTYGILGSGEQPPGRLVAANDVQGHLDLHLTYATMTVARDDRRYVRLRGVDPEVVLSAAEGLHFRGDGQSGG